LQKRLGCVCKNDTNVEFPLLRVVINFNRRADMNNIRTWFYADLEMLDQFKICSKLEGFLLNVAHSGNLTEACRAADEPPRLG
jgi:hypothetical protein